MKRCSDFEPLFTPFVDGQLDEAERARVEAHFEACPPCRDRAVAEQTVRDVVRTRAEALSEQASGALVARCAGTQGHGDARPSRRPGVFGRLSTPSRWVPLSAAATLVLAIGGVFVAGQNERLDAAFAAQMAIDHTRCFESSELEPGRLSAAAVEAAFQRDQGWSVAVPAVAGLELQDARRCEYAHGGMAHLLYRRDGRPVSLFVLPETARRNRDLEIMWHDAVIWSENNRTFVLVGQEGPAEMASVAASIRGVSR